MAHSLFVSNQSPSSSVYGHDDCQKCKTRRIRCDRAFPTCRKCSSRCYVCPGYPSGVKLRWDQGVASRGHLKGQFVPILNQGNATLALDGGRPTSGNEEHITSENIPQSIIAQESAIIAYGSPEVVTILQQRSAQRLLHHYRQMVSPKLPWIDSSDNPWRTTILPLAMNSSSLLSAILSMSAEDLALNSTNAATSHDFSQEANYYRETAMKLLTRCFAEEVTVDAARSLQSKAMTCALATTLVLCNLEMRQPYSTSWRIHLHAARTVIHRCTLTNELPHSKSIGNAFLMQKFFSINVFASMSTFDNSGDLTDDTLSNDYDSIFIDFLRIMQSIVQKRRQQPNYLSRIHPIFTDQSRGCLQIRRKLERARERTFSCSETLKMDSQDVRGNFERVVNMFYYAGLIYSHRMLQIQCCSKEFEIHRDKILEQVNLLTDIEMFSQDLLWPLFIAGTESHGFKKAQEHVETEIRRVMKLSRHWNGLGVLKFLHYLWETNENGALSWIDLAQEWTQQGNELIII